jgi:thiol-disulfide isomerase/thioredoxin
MRRWGRRPAAAASVALALAAVLLGAMPAVAKSLRVGEPMPSLSLNAWSGDSVILDSAAPGVLVVEIWASWCRPCREALPALAELVAQTADPRLRLAAVSIDRDRSVAERFLAEVLPAGGLPLYYDPQAKLPATLGAPGMPTTIVAVDGIVRSVEVGFSPESRERLRILVAEALAAATDSPPVPR